MSPRDAGTPPPSPGDRTAPVTVDWIKLGRHDLTALFHGLREMRDIGAWALLIAFYISTPGPIGPATLVDILPLDAAKTSNLLEKLKRLGRIYADDAGQLRIPMLDEKLTAAAAASARGKTNGMQRTRRGRSTY